MDEIKIGDLITTYWKGYFRVTGFSGNQINFKQVYRANGKPLKSSKEKCCHKLYCHPFKITVEKAFEDYNRLKKMLEDETRS